MDSTKAHVHREYLSYLLIYMSMLGVARIVGFRMEIPFHYFQYLDTIQLRDQLSQSLTYLHAQPPLPNLLLGLALKLEVASAITSETSLFLLQAIAGAATVASLAYLARILIPTVAVRVTVMLLWLLNPMFYSFLFLYFYPVHELAFLAILFVFSFRYLSESRLIDLTIACAALVGCTYTRALFHFAWALIFLILLVSSGRIRRQLVRAPVVRVILLASVLLLVAWPVKNYLQFGFFGSSSWRGYNFSQRLPITLPAVSSIFVEDIIPEQFASIPVVAEPTKSSGAPNWNYYPIIAYQQQLEAEAIAVVRTEPALLLDKAARNYLHGFALYSGRNPYEGTLDRRSTRTGVMYSWVRLYELIVFQYLGNDIRTTYYSGFTFWFPLVTLGALWKLFRRRLDLTDLTPELHLAGLILFTILWVVLMVMFVDGAEGNRMRFSTEPYLFLLAGWLLSSGGTPNGA